MKSPIKKPVAKPEAPFWPYNLLAILLLLAVCYWKMASFRQWVDAKIPWQHAQTAR